MPRKKQPSVEKAESRTDSSQLEERLGYVFKDKELLTTALTHPSAAYEGSACATNQRLEFLGDAVLQLVLSGELYNRFESFEEGPLTKARAKLVNSRTLSEQARRLELGRHLIMGKGEEHQGGRDRQSSLADAFEAVIGAVFLDSNFETARPVVLRMLSTAVKGLAVLPVIENPKGELQELLQSTSPEGPIYEVRSTTGPDHDRVFVCAVTHSGIELACGEGKSKKIAESAAAAAALKKLRETHPKRHSAAQGSGPATR